MRLSLALFASLVTAANGFAFAPPSQSRAPIARFMSDEPSDTSSDDILTVESEPFTPTESESLVTSVLDQLPALGEVNSETRTAINEALLKLESMNPTESPALSPLLNGVWELRYAAGYSPEWALPSPTR